LATGPIAARRPGGRCSTPASIIRLRTATPPALTACELGRGSLSSDGVFLRSPGENTYPLRFLRARRPPPALAGSRSPRVSGSCPTAETLPRLKTLKSSARRRSRIRRAPRRPFLPSSGSKGASVLPPRGPCERAEAVGKHVPPGGVKTVLIPTRSPVAPRAFVDKAPHPRTRTSLHPLRLRRRFSRNHRASGEGAPSTP